MKKEYNFYSDPGHGWMRVPLQDLKLVDVKISSYSYMKGNNAYLEEDCDAPRFINAMNQLGYEVCFKEHTSNHRSTIRNYNSFCREEIA
jgi:hypothetical protein